MCIKSIINERNIEPYFSIEDLRVRAKLSKAVIDILKRCGALDGMSDTDQLSMFWSSDEQLTAQAWKFYHIKRKDNPNEKDSDLVISFNCTDSNGHYHKLGSPVSTSKNSIDHITATNDVELLFYNTLIDDFVVHASDHCPIFVDAIIK